MPRGRRRNTAWIAKGFNYDALFVGVTTFTLATDPELRELAGQNPTIIRIVGRLLFQHRRDSGGFKESARSNYFSGITCLHEDVVSPDPLSAMSEEHWMWSGFAASESTFTEFPIWNGTVKVQDSTTRGTAHQADPWGSIDLDVRSMRKAPEPCELRLIVRVNEVEAETGASHFLSGLLRILVKV